MSGSHIRSLPYTCSSGPVPFMLALESTIGFLLLAELRPWALPIVLPALAVLAVSRFLACVHQRNHSSCSRKATMNDLSAFVQCLLTTSDKGAAQHNRFITPAKLICCSRYSNQLQHFITVQFLRLFHNSRDDLPLQGVLVELLSYLLSTSVSKLQPSQLTLAEIHSVASCCNKIGLFDRSAVSRNLHLEKLPDSDDWKQLLSDESLAIRRDERGQFCVQEAQTYAQLGFISD